MSTFNSVTFDNNVSGLPVAKLMPEFDTTTWFHSAGNSIYLKFLPQDMQQETLRAAFEFAGKISRIDIVNSPPNKVTGATYRMAFIHYDFWYSDPISIDFRSKIVSSYPRPFQMFSTVSNRELSVTINTRPVPKTNYNVDQLSDMFHRLQEQLTMSLEKQEKQAKEIEDLKTEIVELNQKQQHMNCDYSNLAYDIESIDKTVTRLNEDVDEFTDWSDRICVDIENIKTDMQVLKTI